MSCKCRICKSEYPSLIVATACCKKEKALDRLRRMNTRPILTKGVKFKTQQLQLGLSRTGKWCRLGIHDLLSEHCDCNKF